MRAILVLFIAIMIFNLNDAHAYIHPGSGSDFLQMLISAFIAFKQFIKKIFAKLFCSKKDKKK